MPLVEEAMRGKRFIRKINKSFLAIILTAYLLGCKSDTPIMNESKLLEGNSYINHEIEHEVYFTINKTSSKIVLDLLNESIEKLFVSQKALEFSENYSFIPLLLSEDNILYGEGDESSDRSKLFLGAYNLENGEFEKLFPIKTDSKYASIGVIVASNEYVVYEESDQENNISYYYLYDKNIDDVSLLYSISNIPVLHYTQVYVADDGIMFNFYDSDTTFYKNVFYTFDNKSLSIIENENCGFPVKFNDLWYYIRINNDQKITQLIEFDMKALTKKVVYETLNQDQYLIGVYSNQKNVYVLIRENQTNCLYKIDFDNHKFDYLFESEWIESVAINNSYISWLGTNTIANRIRPQYHLYDLKKNCIYRNNGGPVYLSENGIAWIKYKKNDAEIKKGELYNNKNTQIVFEKLEKDEK